MAAFVPLLGSKLTDQGGSEVDTANALEGKDAVLLYFSAHWCPPCRRFTPELATFYKTHAKGKNFELIFVSSDRDEGQFQEYFGEMPWKALPFADRKAKAKLSSKYGVQGIPTLVVLDSEGKVITKNGREKVSTDSDAAEFPWAPEPLLSVLGKSFVRKSGEEVDASAIAGKTVGIYFSASWCPPCKMFTPKLAKFYEEYKAHNPDFEIVFASSDKDEASFKEYFTSEHGDWLALPFADRARKEKLSGLLEVEGIPTFVIVDGNGAVINAGARGVVEGGLKHVLEKGWEPPVLGDFAAGPEAAGTDINSKPSLVAFVEGLDDGEQDDVAAVLEPLAQQYVAAGKASEELPEYLFFISRAPSGVADRVRELTSLGTPSADAAELVLLDIPDQGAYYRKTVEEVTAEAVTQFLSDHKEGKLERLQLGS